MNRSRNRFLKQNGWKAGESGCLRVRHSAAETSIATKTANEILAVRTLVRTGKLAANN